MARLDFWFDLSSPWTRLAFANVQPILVETGASVRWRLCQVFGASGLARPS